MCHGGSHLLTGAHTVARGTIVLCSLRRYADGALGSRAVAIHRRSVRNCPWVPVFWVRAAHAVEKHEGPGAALEVFEQAVGAGLPGAAEHLEVSAILKAAHTSVCSVLLTLTLLVHINTGIVASYCASRT